MPAFDKIRPLSLYGSLNQLTVGPPSPRLALDLPPTPSPTASSCVTIEECEEDDDDNQESQYSIIDESVLGSSTPTPTNASAPEAPDPPLKKKNSSVWNLFWEIPVGVAMFSYHLPQGLVYGLTATTGPLTGLYVSIIPALVYALLNGSSIVSVGVYSALSLGYRELVIDIQTTECPNGESSNLTHLSSHGGIECPLSPCGILACLCLLVGIIQFLIAHFHLARYLIITSLPIMIAFWTASAVRGVTAELFEILGLPHPHESDYPFILQGWYTLLTRIHHANWLSVLLASGTILILLVWRFLVQSWIAKRFPRTAFVIPMNLLLLALLTFISWYFDLSNRYHMKTMPKLLSGRSSLVDQFGFDLKHLELLWAFLPQLLPQAIVLAIISISHNVALEEYYADGQKLEDPKVVAHHAARALGVSNLIGATIFGCFPAAASPARSNVHHKAGGRCPVLSTIISSGLLMLAILYLAPFLESVPKFAIASCLIMSQESTFHKLLALRHFSPTELSHFGVTFILVLILGPVLGLPCAALIARYVDHFEEPHKPEEKS